MKKYKRKEVRSLSKCCNWMWFVKLCGGAMMDKDNYFRWFVEDSYFNSRE